MRASIQRVKYNPLFLGLSLLAGTLRLLAVEAPAETNAVFEPDMILIQRTYPAFPPGNKSRIAPTPVALQPPTTVLDLMAVAPNLGVFESSSGRTPGFSVRGLRDNNLGVGEPQVVMYVDDVPYADLYSRGVPLYGVATMRLGRGPQGTQFGASGPGGVLDIHTHDAGNVWHGQAAASYGSYDSTREQFALGGAVISNALFLDLSGMYFHREGFVRNLVTGKDGDTRETLAGRVKLRWAATPRLEFTLALSGHEFNDGLQPSVPLGSPNLYQVARTFDGYDNQNGYMQSLVAKYFGDTIKVTSITAHTGWREALYQDSDFQPADLLTTLLSRQQTQWSQEIRCESPEADAPWYWRAGAFYARQDFDTTLNTRINAYGVNQLSDQSNQGDNFAAFVHVRRQLTEHWELAAGVRYEIARRDSSGQQANPLLGPPVPSAGTANFASWQPNAEVTWKPDQITRVWLGVARGFMPGGYSFGAAPAPTGYAAAKSWHYELGGERELVSDQVSLRATAFYSQVDDYQVFQPSGYGTFTMLNAAHAHTVGGEAELLVKLPHDIALNLGGGLVSAKFDDFTSPVSGENFSGKTINLVPNYTLNASLTWTPGEHFFFQAGGQIVGPFWYDEVNSAEQEMYGLLNLRAGWNEKHWSVTVFAQNALDTTYTANAIHFNQPPTGSYFTVTPGQPAIIGIEVALRF